VSRSFFTLPLPLAVALPIALPLPSFSRGSGCNFPKLRHVSDDFDVRGRVERKGPRHRLENRADTSTCTITGRGEANNPAPADSTHRAARARTRRGATGRNAQSAVSSRACDPYGMGDRLGRLLAGPRLTH
jgi:hypothetical protein